MVSPEGARDMEDQHGVPIARQSSPNLKGPFRAHSGGGNQPRVNPGLCFFGHFGPWIGRLGEDLKLEKYR